MAVSAIFSACGPSHTGHPSAGTLQNGPPPEAAEKLPIQLTKPDGVNYWQPDEMPVSDSTVTFRYPELSVTFFPCVADQKVYILKDEEDTLDCGPSHLTDGQIIVRSGEFMDWEIRYTYEVGTSVYIDSIAREVDWPGLYFRWTQIMRDEGHRFRFPYENKLPEVFNFVQPRDWLKVVRRQFGDQAADALADVDYGDERVITYPKRLLIKIEGYNPEKKIRTERILKFSFEEGC